MDFWDSRLQLPPRAWLQALTGSVKQFLILQEELSSFSTNQGLRKKFLQPRLPAITGSAKHIPDFKELCSFRHQGLRENCGSALLPIGSSYFVGKEVGGRTVSGILACGLWVCCSWAYCESEHLTGRIQWSQAAHLMSGRMQ